VSGLDPAHDAHIGVSAVSRTEELYRKPRHLRGIQRSDKVPPCGKTTGCSRPETS